MTQDVLYTTFWSQQTRVPPPEAGWLDEDQARVQFEKRDLEIVDATERDADGTPMPRWVIGLGASGRVRVRFFDEHTTLWRLVDYDYVDGRLWRWVTYDHTYSSTDRQWSQRESVRKADALVRPDGSGAFTVVDKSTARPGNRHVTELSDRESDAYWVDYPDFGDWAALAQPGPSAYEVAGREAPARVS